MDAKYDKIMKIGRGAYGIVHLCRRVEDQELVVLKEIPMDDLSTEDRVASKTEISVLRMLNHPNIIGYFDSFLDDKSFMIVMEYAPGGTLYDYLQHRASQNMLLEEEEILKKFAQMLLAIHHIHSHNIIHRDLKTHNILLNKDRKIVKIGDFGISKIMTKTNASTLVGSPHYLSPELCQNHPYNLKSDVWALGCVLYELATLKRPFDADNISAIVCKIMRGTFDPISEHYSEELNKLIKSLLTREPDKRPPVNTIMAQPIIINPLFDLPTDLGRIPCKALPRPTGGLQAALPPRRHSPRSSAESRQRQVLSSLRHGTTTSDSVELSEILGTSKASAVYIWGSASNSVPTRLPLPQGEQDITQVSTGRTMKLGLTSSGRILAWESQTISDTLTSVSTTFEGRATEAAMLSPRFLEGFSGLTVTQISCGDLSAAVLTDRGMLLTFGSGTHGCLGHGGFNDATKPKIVEALLGSTVLRISCGASHVMALTDKHEVFAWGRGDSGRLGLGDTESKTVPAKVSIDANSHVSEILCGVDCSFILTKERAVYVCGNNRGNKLGLWGDEREEDVSEEILSFCQITSLPLSEEHIRLIATGTSHAVYLTEDGVLYTVGSNVFQQLGYQREDNSVVPQKVISLQDYFITNAACGDTFTVAVTQDGDIFTWGQGKRGRLGRIAKDSSPVPIKVDFPIHERLKVDSLAVNRGNTLLTGKVADQSL